MKIPLRCRIGNHEWSSALIDVDMTISEGARRGAGGITMRYCVDCAVLKWASMGITWGDPDGVSDEIRDDERARVEQSNDVARVVFRVMERHGIFAYLDLRYDIADAVYAAGYRKPSDLGAGQ